MLRLDVQRSVRLRELRLEKESTVFAPFRIWSLAGVLLAGPVFAAEPSSSIGYVMKVQGEASVTQDGATQAATIGTPLYLSLIHI